VGVLRHAREHDVELAFLLLDLGEQVIQDTSPGIPMAFPPILLATAANCDWRRPVTKNVAPSFTNCRAVARPNPLFPPVIRAISPEACRMVDVLVLGQVNSRRQSSCLTSVTRTVSVASRALALRPARSAAAVPARTERPESFAHTIPETLLATADELIQ
jgi:hypothetical protein